MSLLPNCGRWVFGYGHLWLYLLFLETDEEQFIPFDTSAFTIERDGIVIPSDLGAYWDEPDVFIIGSSVLPPETSLRLSYNGSNPLFKAADGTLVSAFMNMNCFYTEWGGDPGFPDVQNSKTKYLNMTTSNEIDAGQPCSF